MHTHNPHAYNANIQLHNGDTATPKSHAQMSLAHKAERRFMIEHLQLMAKGKHVCDDFVVCAVQGGFFCNCTPAADEQRTNR